MLSALASRHNDMIRFRSVAIMRGPFFVRICDLSSPNVASLTQCSLFSMDQCPRLKVSNFSASALSAVRLVIPYEISSLVFIGRISNVSRFTRKTCPTCGNCKYSFNFVLVWIVRISNRPCFLSIVLNGGGKITFFEGVDIVE